MSPKSSKQGRPSRRLVSVLFLLCFAFTLSARAANPCAPPSFNTAAVMRLPVNSSPSSVVTADFNRDGRADLAAAVQLNGGSVALLLGDGDGTFLAPTYVPARDNTFPVISAIEVVVTGDFNGDGAPDLAVSWNGDEISVMLNNGDGTFGGPSRLVGGGTGPTSLATADLNGDAKLDLVLSNANSANVSVFLGNGAGGFAGPTLFNTGGQPVWVTVGEFNGDGKPDLAVAGGNVIILLGNGAGAFGAPTSFPTAGSASRVAIADFNGDGKSDLVAGHFFSNQISVLFGTGTGSFNNRLDFDAGKDSRTVATGDFNRDGKADILAVNRESDDVMVFSGDGAGHFGTPKAFIAGYGPVHVAEGEFNGDGERDLVTANIFGGSISILLGKGGGAFAASSSLPGTGQFGNFASVAGDFNSDGKSDILVSDYPNKTVSVMPGDGTGRFGARVTSPTLNPAFSIATANLDGDGKLDLVTLERGDTIENSVSVLLANGDGTFRQKTSVNAGVSLSRLVVADFNNDGKRDVAATTSSGPSKVLVFLGDGAGGLSAPASFNVGSGAQDLAAADFNNDGKIDIATANFFAGSVSVILGDGAGNFAAPTSISVGGEAVSLAAGDFNADGKQDLAVLVNTFGGVGVLIGKGDGTFEERTRLSDGFVPISVRTGDYNGDGATDLAVVENRADVVTIHQGDGAGNFVGPFDFYAGAGPTLSVNADFNGDGKTDILVTGVTIVPLINTLGTGTPTVQLCPSNYNVNEGVKNLKVLVSRGGDTSGAASVAYTTQNNTASDTSDYTTAVGTLRFAPGEVSKSFTLFITDDAYAEPVESFFVKLTEATGARLGQPVSLLVNITDNETSPGPNPVAPESFDTFFFVRQHYVDFLNREPDAAGLAFWANEIEKCGADAQCKEVRRINVSAAFFLSIEFQETGYLVQRTYKSAYGDATSPGVSGTVPVVRPREFLADTQQIGQGVVVNVGDWQAQLEANKQAYMLDFVRRPRFANAYPASMSAEEFVAKLDQNSGGVLSQSERAQLVASLTPAPSDAAKRAAALRQVAESQTLRQRELNRAFVLMEYFGYLRRNPDDAPEVGLNYAGWKFWLDKLNQFNGNFVQAEMVKAFITSDEYRHRFGQ